jgi:hypothetical protein
MKPLFILLLSFAIDFGCTYGQTDRGNAFPGRDVGTTIACPTPTPSRGLSVVGVNGIANALCYAGATAAAQMTACLAANTICDGRGYGATTQLVDMTIEVGIAGKYKKLLLDPATTFKPTGSSSPSVMFKVNRNGQLEGVHVAIASDTNYSGKVIDVEDTISMDQFSIKDAFIDGSSDMNTGYCVFLSPPSGSHIQVARMENIWCNAMHYGLYLHTSGSAGYINGLVFDDFFINGRGTDAVTLDAGSGTLGIGGNSFNNFQVENAKLRFTGSAQIWGNHFINWHIWDQSPPVVNSNSSASGNTFIGHTDSAFADSQNTYFLEGATNQIVASGIISGANDTALVSSVGSGKITSATFVSVGLVLSTVPANMVKNGRCDISYSAGDSSHSFTLGESMSAAPRFLAGSSTVWTSTSGAFTYLNYSLSATSPAPISMETTPGMRNGPIQLNFTLATASSPVTLTIDAKVAPGGVLTLSQGSRCYWLP